MKLSYEYDTEYFERLNLTDAKERGDMHAAYLLNKLKLTEQGVNILAEWFLAVHQGLRSRSKQLKETVEVVVRNQTKQPVEVKVGFVPKKFKMKKASGGLF